MAVEDKFNDMTKATEKLEKKFVNELQSEYSKAYKEMKKKINNFIGDYGEDGKLTPESAMKFNRLQKLESNLYDELKKVESLQGQKLTTYLADAYERNYYGTGFALETESLVKLNYAIVDRNAVRRMVQNPLMKGALEDLKSDSRARLRRHLTQSVMQGEGIRETAGKIRKDLEISGNKATQIARTETTKVMGQARKDSMDHAANNGVTVQKRWVATLDSRTRDTHARVDGQTVDIDDTFSVNGTEMDRPGDPSAPAKEVVNCRCTMISVIPEIDYDQRRITQTNELGDYQTYEEWQKDRVHDS